MGKALETLRRREGEGDGKTRFLYNVNKGLVLSILGDYEESNGYFEKAFLFGEDYRINYVAEATSYLSNPNVTAYRGEDHEHLMVLYFKAINYLKMNKPEEALVECRRLNIRSESTERQVRVSGKISARCFHPYAHGNYLSVEQRL